MKEIDVTFEVRENVGHWDRNKITIYSLLHETANVLISGGDGRHEDVDETSKVVFENDIKTILRLAKKEIPIIEGKIANNMRVYHNMKGADRKDEMDKAIRNFLFIK